MIRADPFAIESNANGGRAELPGRTLENFYDVDQRLACLGWSSGLVSVVELNVELGLGRTTGITGWTCDGCWLSESSGSQQQESKESLHSTPCYCDSVMATATSA